MDSKDDIFDELDDSDDLVRSIEAGREGPWDEEQEFVDPKLAALQQQMSQPQQVDYRERRLRDLETMGLPRGKKAKRKSGKKGKVRKQTIKKLSAAEARFAESPPAQKGSGTKRSAKSTRKKSTTPWDEDLAKGDSKKAKKSPRQASPWGDAGSGAEPDLFGAKAPSALSRKVAHASVSDPGESVAAATLAAIEQRQARQQAGAAFAATMLRSVAVFGGVAAAVAAAASAATDQAIGIDLLYRSAAAAFATGALWFALRTTRASAALVGALAFGAAFVPFADLEQTNVLIGLGAGLIVAVVGSSLLGAWPNKAAAENDFDSGDE
ncbi:MAG: hypothetical protein AB8H80_11115 [Planctomycetota bacterium]